MGACLRRPLVRLFGLEPRAARGIDPFTTDV